MINTKSIIQIINCKKHYICHKKTIHLNKILLQNKIIAYKSWGAGKAVVFLHGFLENQTMWDVFIPELSKTHQIITLDLLGHGLSDVGTAMQTMEEQAETVAALLAFLEIKKATLIGHSMGGYVALAFADLYPEKTEGIALLNSTPLPDSDERKMNRDRAVEAFKSNKNITINLSIENLFAKENQKRMVKTVQKVQKEALQTPLEGIIASLKGMKLRKDRTFILENKKFKNLLILGKQDAVLPYIETAKIAQNTHTKLIPLAGGHMSHLENTTEVFEAIITYLNT